MDCYKYFKTFKTPTTELPMKAEQAATLSDMAYKNLCEEAIQENLTRWKDSAIEAIEAAAKHGNYSTSIWIYIDGRYDKFEEIGLEDFCKWLRVFGYKVFANDTKIHISWEALK